MNVIEDAAWLTKLRYRLEDFRATAIFAQGTPCSLKIRPHTGHFCGASAPHAYALIEQRTRGFLSSTIWLGDHDTGPEVLCVLTMKDGQATLRASVAALLQEIFQAAEAGIGAGDSLDRRLDLLWRGFDESGAYFEHLVMRVEPDAPAHSLQAAGGKAIVEAFARWNICFTENRKTSQQKFDQPQQSANTPR
ncbi:MAG: hypothetical protein H6R19_1060 [Proteobacteria bacterium]|nr:hypothetical protein [Pseudomonadota bacterium]